MWHFKYHTDVSEVCETLMLLLSNQSIVQLNQHIIIKKKKNIQGVLSFPSDMV